MKRDRHILAGAWLLAMACLVVGSCRTGPFDEQDIEAARLLGLKRQYDTLDEAISYLLEVNSEAMRENPDLRFVERGLHRVNEMRSDGLPGEAEYLKYRASYPDPQKFEQTYTRCRQAFGIEQWARPIPTGPSSISRLLQSRASECSTRTTRTMTGCGGTSNGTCLSWLNARTPSGSG
ncbi:MAG: hypothetical protein ACYTBJ_15635 [Planctomycetota bacterium]